MKTALRVMDVQSNIQGEKIGMGIDDSALQHIMSVLTDLYSDPELAVLREYSTNAWDAHRDAGVTQPIEVDCPTPLSPFFKVRDFGEGLDIEDIRNIYSRYGSSTKRESNNVVGMLGLGCKSALTYTDQFTLTGYKNGIMTQVSVSRDADGTGSMTIVAEQPSDEPSGVQIIVPAKMGNTFEQKANTFFSFWDEGSVLVNGKAPKRIDGLWLTDKILLTSEIAASQVVMGNVAYPIPNGALNWQNYRSRVVAFVDIGEVNFTPSREALMMTKLTKDTLARIGREVTLTIPGAVQREVDKVTTPWEAIKAYSQTTTLTGQNPSVAFNNIQIPAKLEGDVMVKSAGYNQLDTSILSVEWQPRYRSKGWLWVSYMPALSGIQCHVFKGFTHKTMTARMRDQLKLWYEKKKLDPTQTILCVDKLPASFKDWIDPKQIFKWDDVAAIELPKDPNAPARQKYAGTYKVWRGSYFKDVPADEIDDTKRVFYCGSHHYPWRSLNVFFADDDFELVSLPENRVEKFRRLFPKAENANDFLVKKAVEWKQNLTYEQRMALTFSTRQTPNASILQQLNLDASRVDDPKLKKAIREVATKASTKLVEAYNMHAGKIGTSGIFIDYADPLKEYPLLASIRLYGSTAKDHLYIYLNAAYAARKENEGV